MHYRKNGKQLDIGLSDQFQNKPVSFFFDTYDIAGKDRYLYKQKKQILLNGQPVHSDDEILHRNDTLTVIGGDEDVDWAPASRPCRVMYENDFLLIAHKEPGIIIHSEKDDPDCLNGQMARYLLDHNLHCPVRPIHRLDKETSGLVLYVKFPFFQAWFDHQLRERKISRHYKAIAKGRPLKPGTSFIIDRPIGRDRHHAGQYLISSSGKPARTEVTVLSVSGEYILFGCVLDTGRTHQIRVHLSSKGYPIVNDVLYGHPDRAFAHMCLWADTITFRDPLSHKKHTIHDLNNPDFDAFAE